MSDLEKVVEGLRHCTAWAGLHECQPKIGPDCPYEDEADCKLALMRDALTLLKEQEAKQAIKQTYYVMMNRDYENPVEVTHYDWLCPTCKGLLCRDIDVIDDNYHFCKVCGQAVKWV